MSDPRDYKLDVSSLSNQEKAAETDSDGRPYLSVLFACCSVFQRIYRNDEGTEYVGRCPRCMRQIRFVIGPDGTNERSFVVS